MSLNFCSAVCSQKSIRDQKIEGIVDCDTIEEVITVAITLEPPSLLAVLKKLLCTCAPTMGFVIVKCSCQKLCIYFLNRQV